MIVLSGEKVNSDRKEDAPGTFRFFFDGSFKDSTCSPCVHIPQLHYLLLPIFVRDNRFSHQVRLQRTRYLHSEVE